MPLMPSDVPQALEAVLKVVYLEEVAAQKPTYERVTTVVPTTQETQDYGWVGSPPAVREFIDERVGKGLAISGFTIKDKTWEATLAISRRALENDQMGEIKMRVRELARRMLQGVDKRVWTMLTECYTGRTHAYGLSWDTYDKNGVDVGGSLHFASASHSYPAPAEYTAAQDNFPDDAMTEADVFTQYGAMCTWKDDRGELIPYVPDLLIASPKIFPTALRICTPGGAIIPAADIAHRNVGEHLGLQVMMCPYWAVDTAAGTSNWALACTSGVTKPVILQLFTPAANGQLFEFSALEGNSDNGFMRDMYYYGIRGRWECGYGDWRTWIFNAVA